MARTKCRRVSVGTMRNDGDYSPTNSLDSRNSSVKSDIQDIHYSKISNNMKLHASPRLKKQQYNSSNFLSPYYETSSSASSSSSVMGSRSFDERSAHTNTKSTPKLSNQRLGNPPPEAGLFLPGSESHCKVFPLVPRKEMIRANSQKAKSISTEVLNKVNTNSVDMSRLLEKSESDFVLAKPRDALHVRRSRSDVEAYSIRKKRNTALNRNQSLLNWSPSFKRKLRRRTLRNSWGWENSPSKSFRTVSLLVGLQLVTWLPYSTLVMVYVLYPDHAFASQLMHWLSVVLFSSCALQPVVYGVLNRAIRKQARALVTRCRNRHSPLPSLCPCLLSSVSKTEPRLQLKVRYFSAGRPADNPNFNQNRSNNTNEDADTTTTNFYKKLTNTKNTKGTPEKTQTNCISALSPPKLLTIIPPTPSPPLNDTDITSPLTAERLAVVNWNEDNQPVCKIISYGSDPIKENCDNSCTVERSHVNIENSDNNNGVSRLGDTDICTDPCETKWKSHDNPVFIKSKIKKSPLHKLALNQSIIDVFLKSMAVSEHDLLNSSIKNRNRSNMKSLPKLHARKLFKGLTGEEPQDDYLHILSQTRPRKRSTSLPPLKKI